MLAALEREADPIGRRLGESGEPIEHPIEQQGVREYAEADAGLPGLEIAQRVHADIEARRGRTQAEPAPGPGQREVLSESVERRPDLEGGHVSEVIQIRMIVSLYGYKWQDASCIQHLRGGRDRPESCGMDAEALRPLLAAAVEAAEVAADPIRRYYRASDMGLVSKADGLPVTRADREAEAVIRAKLAVAPGGPFDILGEEEGLSGGGTRLR